MKLVLFTLLSISALFSFEKLTQENFEEKTLNKKVILDFYSKSCRTCKDLVESLIEYNENKKQDVVIYKIDIEEEISLAKEFSVRVIPTLIYFKDDDIIERELGTKTPEQIAKSVQEYLQ
ncbi:thioredoxin family protein [Arcobacteraceae bacterium]|nr:thioredoxin family protein [Arcobacteraceae bacterium]